ncbi:hypothetical protein [Legionella jamestowniensis]|uniref:Dot/Icm secretion system substrate n=1 Tax=Legionella jamestowniensis TaxID=455 RepID=A0A0W0UGB0_9GAMM|nr:hypothetical protein [Legionella jamestowniensis]KTD06913.1 Dot/Icm secretion system substrate [Legionella jamestowniensis]OCH97436.1 hypothetical protein A8135_02890 [Legionella jamestowniensis]SFL85213.1 hypothetical protein SAMN02746073_2260 [Legionella jamestowniensis DSM 19215]
MLSPVEAEKLVLEEKENGAILEQRKQRINEAVDVSAALNNCFFHAYALHLLSNQHVFPPNLFDLTEFDGEHIVTLKEMLSKDVVLQHELTTASTPDYLFEKTLVLGILFRSWFCAQLFHSEAGRDALFDFKGDAYNGDIRVFTFLRMASEYQDALFTPVSKTRSLFQNLQKEFPTWQHLLEESADVPEDVSRALEQLLPAEIEASIATLQADEKNPLKSVESLKNAEQILKRTINILEEVKKKLQPEHHNPLIDAINEAKKSLNCDLVIEQQSALVTVEMKYYDFPIYIANKHFFNETLLNKDLEFIQEYWHKEGYENFCKFLNLSNTKISYADVDPILTNLIHLPYAIYSERDGSFLVGNLDASMELALDFGRLDGGHYKLLTNPKTIELLQHYPSQKEHYLRNREAFLARKAPAKDLIKDTVFVEAIIPKSALDSGTPLDFLLGKLPLFLENLKQKVGQTSQKEDVGSSSASEGKEPPPPSEVLENTTQKGDSTRPLTLTEVSDQRDPLSVAVDSGETIQEPPENETPETINPQDLSNTKLQKFYQQLEQLRGKAEELRGKAEERKQKRRPFLNYKRAANDAEALYNELYKAFNEFVKSPGAKEFERFNQQSLAAIEKHQPTLERHRNEYGQLKQIIGNIVLAIAGIGIFYGVALMINRTINGRYFFFAPQTAQNVSKLENMLPEIAPENKSTF